MPNKTHLRGHVAVGCLALYSTAGIIRSPSPDGLPLFGCVHMTAERPLIRLFRVQKSILMDSQELLGHGHVDVAFIGLHQLLPAHAPRVGR